MRVLVTLLPFLLLAPASALAHDDGSPPAIAFPRVHGPRAAGRGPTARGVIRALEAAGVEVRRGRPLQGAAEELGLDVYAIEVARVADCDFLALVELARRGRGFVARARLLRTTDGAEVAAFDAPYRSGRGAERNGAEVGARLARAAQDDLEARRPAAPPAAVRTRPEKRAVQPRGAAELPAGSSPAPRSAAPSPPEPEPAPSPAAPRSATAPAPAAEAQTETKPPDPARSRSPERALFRVELGVGSRLHAAYSVLTGGAPTGLGYTLDPLFAADARVLFELPVFPVGLEASLGVRPVRFVIDTDPAVVPSEPSGQQIETGGNLWWRIDVARFGGGDVLSLTPFAGVDYAALIVEEQGQNTVVGSWSAFAVGGGLRAGLELDQSIALELEGEAGPVLGYQESPGATGRDPSGFRASGRFRARWWLTGLFGAQLAASYDYQAISLVGPGTRAIFEGDPALMDAEVLTESVDAVMSVVLAFP